MGVVKTVPSLRRGPSQPSAGRPRARAVLPAGQDEGTREHIATIVGQDGPITVASLAERLQLTTVAVRRHLDLMQADGLVEARDEVPVKRGRGRPAKAYVLTGRGHQQSPSGSSDLATEALQFLAEHAGPQAVQAFAEQRAAAMEARLRPIIDRAGDDPEARVAALAAALRVEGYAATTRPVAQGTAAEAVQLCQGHCPIHHVAATFPDFCEAEVAAFARLIGTDVRRLATLAQGDHVCTTHIPIGPPEQRRRTQTIVRSTRQEESQ